MYTYVYTRLMHICTYTYIQKDVFFFVSLSLSLCMYVYIYICTGILYVHMHCADMVEHSPGLCCNCYDLSRSQSRPFEFGTGAWVVGLEEPENSSSPHEEMYLSLEFIGEPQAPYGPLTECGPSHRT